MTNCKQCRETTHQDPEGRATGQQARTIRSRFDILFENDAVDPQRLAETSEEELRKTGLSLAKARCSRSLTEHVLSDIRSIASSLRRLMVKPLSVPLLR